MANASSWMLAPTFNSAGVRLGPDGKPLYRRSGNFLTAPQSDFQGGLTSALENGPTVRTPAIKTKTNPDGSLDFQQDSGPNAAGLSKPKPGDPAAGSFGGLLAQLGAAPPAPATNNTLQAVARQVAGPDNSPKLAAAQGPKEGDTKTESGKIWEYRIDPNTRQGSWVVIDNAPDQGLGGNPEESGYTFWTDPADGKQYRTVRGGGTLQVLVNGQWTPIDESDNGAPREPQDFTDNQGVTWHYDNGEFKTLVNGQWLTSTEFGALQNNGGGTTPPGDGSTLNIGGVLVPKPPDFSTQTTDPRWWTNYSAWANDIMNVRGLDVRAVLRAAGYPDEFIGRLYAESDAALAARNQTNQDKLTTAENNLSGGGTTPDNNGQGETTRSVEDLRELSNHVWDLINGLGISDEDKNNVLNILSGIGVGEVSVDAGGQDQTLANQFAESLAKILDQQAQGDTEITLPGTLLERSRTDSELSKLILDVKKLVAGAEDSDFETSFKLAAPEYDSREETLRQRLTDTISRRMGYDPVTGAYTGVTGFEQAAKDKLIAKAREQKAAEAQRRGIYQSPASLADLDRYLAEVDVQDLLYQETKQSTAIDQAQRLAEYISTEDRARHAELRDVTLKEEEVRAKRSDELAARRLEVAQYTKDRDASTQAWARVELEKVQTQEAINNARRQTNLQMLDLQDRALATRRSDERGQNELKLKARELEATITNNNRQIAILAEDTKARINALQAQTAGNFMGTEYSQNLGELGAMLEGSNQDFGQWLQTITTEQGINRALEGAELDKVNSLLGLLGLNTAYAGQSLAQILGQGATDSRTAYANASGQISQALMEFLKPILGY